MFKNSISEVSIIRVNLTSRLTIITIVLFNKIKLCNRKRNTTAIQATDLLIIPSFYSYQ
ncbi:hypothetical protein HLPCO_001617 [Haloplasma contractile SSD-17B]|uniref:Uncharacterized protein n=1 Tax=Haloplasma contractile SSD-17B TaxID=1033810 RepID=U2ECY8_9MOLU|nr:hypothetical protein HLPCO_001617 [Haloplasma contractile SSD-17B]